MQLHGAANGRENLMAEWCQQDGVKPGKGSGNKSGSSVTIPGMEKKHTCEKVLANLSPDATRGNLQSRRLQWLEEILSRREPQLGLTERRPAFRI